MDENLAGLKAKKYNQNGIDWTQQPLRIVWDHLFVVEIVPPFNLKNFKRGGPMENVRLAEEL